MKIIIKRKNIVKYADFIGNACTLFKLMDCE